MTNLTDDFAEFIILSVHAVTVIAGGFNYFYFRFLELL